MEKPLAEEGVEITAEALSRLLEVTQAYAFFIQEWGSQAWLCTAGSPIDLADVQAATKGAIAALDEGFFRMRFDRLTERERAYLRAVAELGPGPHRSGAIARAMRTTVASLAPLRNGLILKGMIWSPAHGDTAFTVPLFDEFMKRIMPA